MTGSTGAPTSASKTDTSQTDKILAGGTEEVGAPTPAAKSPVSPQTGVAESTGASMRSSMRSGDTLRSNVADTPGTHTSGSGNRMVDQVRHQGQRGMDAAQAIVRENPVASTIVALGVGLLLGTLLSQGGRGGSGSSHRQRNY
jgi:ElaB/YqjD/DUF883 family membrane-anchored ribosome-binding protein